jgi:hypothetical protein
MEPWKYVGILRHGTGWGIADLHVLDPDDNQVVIHLGFGDLHRVALEALMAMEPGDD